MPMVRAMRLMNSIEAGSTTGAQLQAQLINGGVQSDFNSIMQLPGQCSVLAGSLTAISAVNLSPIATGLTANNPIPNLAMSRNTIARNYIFSSARNLLNALVVAAPQNWYPYATWTSSFGAGLNYKNFNPGTALGNFIAYGNGTYVTTSGTTDRTVYTSPDGSTWTARANALPVQAGGRWMGVAFGNGVFIAVSGGSATSTTAAISTDGITWTAQTLPLAQWTNLACGLVSGTFTWVVISGGTSDSSVTARSTDNGATWTAGGTISSSRWASIAYGNERFVTVSGGFPWLSSQSNTACYYTTNGGTSWAYTGLPDYANWSGVVNNPNPTYSNYWVAVNSSGYNMAYSSNNGVTWSTLGAYADGNTWWIAATPSGLITYNRYSDISGTSWSSQPTASNTASSYYASSPIYANGAVRLVSQISPYFMSYSQANASSTGFIYGFEYSFRVTSSLFANNQYCLFGYGGYYTSPDQQTWTWNAVPAFCVLGGPVAVAFNGASTFVALFGGANGSGASINQCATSTDNGVTWTFRTLPRSTLWTSVAYGNGRFVAVSGWPNRAIYAGANSVDNEGAYSTDGLTWTVSNLTSTWNFSHVMFANGYFVASSPSSAAVQYSTTGTGWTPGFGGSGQPRQVAFGTVGGQPYWVSSASDGTNAYINISVGSSPTASPTTYSVGSDAATVGTLYSMSYANGYFFTTTNTASTNWVYTSSAPSSSATSWTRTTLPATAINPSTILTSTGPISICYYPTTGATPTVLGVSNL